MTGDEMGGGATARTGAVAGARGAGAGARGAGAGERPYHHGNLRAALLDAAEAELEASGIERFSLRAVAKRAGVSHAAPAHHFSDATGLLTALAIRGYGALTVELDAAGDAIDEPTRRIDGAGVGYVRFAMERPALFRLMFSSSRPDFDDPGLKAASDAAFGALARDIEALAGVDPFGSDAALADLMIAWGLVHGLADLMNAGRLTPLLSRPAPERERTVRTLMRRALGTRS